MPTPCSNCNEIVELNDMQNSPRSTDKFMVCDECDEKIQEEIDEEENSGSETDFFGNTIDWKYHPDDWLIYFYLNNEEVTCWSIEIEKEDAVDDFMKVWNLAQQSNPQK